MSRKDKLLAKIQEKPTPTDISWQELLSLLKHLGFKEQTPKGGSSHFRFFIPDEAKSPIFIPKPHPGNEVRPHYIKEAVIALKERGIIK